MHEATPRQLHLEAVLALGPGVAQRGVRRPAKGPLADALAGEHFYDGLITNYRKEEAKEIIAAILARLNEGESLGPREVETALGDHIA